MKCSDKWLREQIKQLFDEIHETNHPVGTKTWLREWKGSRDIILGLLDEREAELRERLGALRNDRLLRDVRKHPKGKTIVKIQLIKEVLGVDE